MKNKNIFTVCAADVCVHMRMLQFYKGKEVQCAGIESKQVKVQCFKSLIETKH